MKPFQAMGRPLLIGSLPLDDHKQAVNLVFEYTPEIPLWVQLPMHKQEGMMIQFLPGLPGLTNMQDEPFIDTESDNFNEDLLTFYEDFISVTDGQKDIYDSRFILTAETAKGFFVFMERLKSLPNPPDAVKGQITGPITLGTSIKDQNGRAIFYNEQIRDAAVKLVAQKARWQVLQLMPFGRPVIIFFDEPALAGFGSSAFISISKEEVSRCFEEVIGAVHTAGGLAGIHVCANADWSIILESSADIVSFDAYSYFDKFILYADLIKSFIAKGGVLAWGIVPTSNVDDIEKETTDSLLAKWEKQVSAVAKLGIDRTTILTQSLITPSCGTGSLSLEHAHQVLSLTQHISDRLRKNEP